MHNEHNDIARIPAFITNEGAPGNIHPLYTGSREGILASLALLLGPETDEAMRQRAAKRLVKQELTSLPLVLTTLNQYPDITTPAWPWWPPQYQYCARLLLRWSQRARVSLETLLQHPALTQPIGPVLWISAIEAADIQPSAEHEALLRDGLSAAWATVRYAAAMALANLAGTVFLSTPTIQALQAHVSNTESLPVRLTAAFTLLRSNDGSGLTTLMELLGTDVAEDARRAALFLLATTPPVDVTADQRERLTRLLLAALQDTNGEIALHAAHILPAIAPPSILPSLSLLLELPQPQLQIAVLTVLEELVSRPTMRQAIGKSSLPSRMSELLRSDIAEVRRQASFTLAMCGGEYAAVALGTTLLSKEHPGQLEATEGIRLLHNALHPATRNRITGWLLQSLDLAQSQHNYKNGEELQIAALDSLAYLAWQARGKRHTRILTDISNMLFSHTQSARLLTSSSAWVRQRAIECFSLLNNIPPTMLQELLRILHGDEDSGVRACCACTLGEIVARTAIPDLMLALLDLDEAVAETALYALCRIATPTDTIVLCAIRELAMYGHGGKATLARAAQKQLKTWGTRTC